MLSLILAILFGLSITYFAFQNAVGVPVTFANYQLTGVPLYLVVVIATLSGILMAWFISAVEGFSSLMSLRRKDGIINNDRKEISALHEKIQHLEVENAKLRGDNRGVVLESRDERVDDRDIRHKPSILERLFPSSNRRYTKNF